MGTLGAQAYDCRGGKYLEVLPPTIALNRNRAKQVPEKKTARTEFQLWKLALALVVARGCVPAVSRRGCCHPAWPPYSLPCSSPAGEITKELINGRQPPGRAHPCCPNDSRHLLWLDCPRPGGHVILLCH